MNKYLPLLAGVSLACVGSIASADQFLNLEANFMNGAVFVPLFTQIDTNLDGTADKLQMRFNVYTAGTTTKTLSTKPRAVAYPADPCTNSSSINRDFSVRFAGAISTARRHMIIDMYTECWESGTGELKEAHTAVLYSAKVVSGTGAGSSWVKNWNGWQVLGSTGVDWDSDGTTEMMLSMTKDVSNSTKARNLFIQMSDGTIEADNIYTAGIAQ